METVPFDYGALSPVRSPAATVHYTPVAAKEGHSPGQIPVDTPVKPSASLQEIPPTQPRPGCWSLAASPVSETNAQSHLMPEKQDDSKDVEAALASKAKAGACIMSPISIQDSPIQAKPSPQVAPTLMALKAQDLPDNGKAQHEAACPNKRNSASLQQAQQEAAIPVPEASPLVTPMKKLKHVSEDSPDTGDLFKYKVGVSALLQSSGH